MGIEDFLFGSDPEVVTTNQPLLSPDQMAALSAMMRKLMAGPMTGEEAYTPYGKEMAAPLSGLQNLSLSALEKQTINEAVGGSGSAKAAAQELDRIIKSGGSPIDINDYFTKAVQDPMLRDFEEKILPMLQSSFTGSSAFGSDKLRQQKLLTSDLTKNLTTSRADISYRSQKDALDRMMTALGLQPQVAGASSGILGQGLTAGGIPQATQQAKLSADYNEFLRGQKARESSVSQLMNMVGMQTFQPQTVVTPGSQGLLGSAAQGAGQFLAKWGMGKAGLTQ